MAMTAVILILMTAMGKSPLFIGLIAVLGFFMYAVRPVIQAWLMESSPKHMAGTSVGILFGMQSVGQSISLCLAA